MAHTRSNIARVSKSQAAASLRPQASLSRPKMQRTMANPDHAIARVPLSVSSAKSVVLIARAKRTNRRPGCAPPARWHIGACRLRQTGGSPGIGQAIHLYPPLRPQHDPVLFHSPFRVERGVFTVQRRAGNGYFNYQLSFIAEPGSQRFAVVIG